MAVRLDADMAIAREAARQAELEAQKVADALARIERDYIDGRITAEKWTRLERTLTDEFDAAVSALTRAQEHAEQVSRQRDMEDVEQALLTHLAKIRTAVADASRTART